MLFFSLGVCFSIVGAVAVTLHRGQLARWLLLGLCGIACVQLQLLLPLLQCLITFFVLLIDWNVKRSSPRWIAVNVAPICLVCMTYGVIRWREFEQLRDKYPYESMEARLPERDLSPATGSAQERDFLTSVTRELDQNRSARSRSDNLRALHEASIHVFVNSPGFGVGRRINHNPGETNLRIEQEDLPSKVSQPGESPRVTWTREDLDAADDAPTYGYFGKLHRESYVGFVFAQGFGFAKDRSHAAGFHSHGFSLAALESNNRWRIQRIDLVSLLLHDAPAVYVSDNLPQMKDVENVPTRPLSLFEQTGLAAIRDGDVLFARRKDEHLFMVGGIRAVKQCTNCHECNDGDLLGAFSYVLRKESKPLQER